MLHAIEDHPDLELQLVIAASALLDRYGSAVDYIERDGFTVTAKVFNILEGENLTAAAKTTGIGILELSTVFDNLKPDIVVTIADRFETMSTAISASYMNIPLGHIQGGEVTGNIDEKVRHSITKLADYHFVASEGAKQRVLSLGEDETWVYNTGCPSIDLADEVALDSEFGFNLFDKYKGVGRISDDWEQEYIVVLQHPVTNEYEESRIHVEETLNAVNDLNIPTFWFWPNVDAGSDGTSKGIRVFREQHSPDNIYFIKNMEPQDFLKLLIRSSCLVGNSSVGIRECAYLGVPVVNIGTRQNRRDRGNNVIDVDYSADAIKAAIQKWREKGKPESSNVYGGGDAGKQIADLLSKVELRFHKTITF